jgi:hypothetical protein
VVVKDYAVMQDQTGTGDYTVEESDPHNEDPEALEARTGLVFIGRFLSKEKAEAKIQEFLRTASRPLNEALPETHEAF